MLVAEKESGPQRSEGQLAIGEGSKLGNEPPFCAATMRSFRSVRNTQCADGNYLEPL